MKNVGPLFLIKLNMKKIYSLNSKDGRNSKLARRKTLNFFIRVDFAHYSFICDLQFGGEEEKKFGF